MCVTSQRRNIYGICKVDILGDMSKSKTDLNPEYRLIPSSLKPRFESGELDVKCLFLVSDLAFEVIKMEGYVRGHLPRDRTSEFLKSLLTKNYRRTVDLLIAEDIIQVRSNEHGKESYSTTHHHCKQYSLTKKYRDELNNDGISGLLITDYRQYCFAISKSKSYLLLLASDISMVKSPQVSLVYTTLSFESKVLCICSPLLKVVVTSLKRFFSSQK